MKQKNDSNTHILLNLKLKGSSVPMITENTKISQLYMSVRLQIICGSFQILISSHGSLLGALILGRKGLNRIEPRRPEAEHTDHPSWLGTPR